MTLCVINLGFNIDNTSKTLHVFDFITFFFLISCIWCDAFYSNQLFYLTETPEAEKMDTDSDSQQPDKVSFCTASFI